MDDPMCRERPFTWAIAESSGGEHVSGEAYATREEAAAAMEAGAVVAEDPIHFAVREGRGFDPKGPRELYYHDYEGRWSGGLRLMRSRSVGLRKDVVRFGVVRYASVVLIIFGVVAVVFSWFSGG